MLQDLTCLLPEVIGLCSFAHSENVSNAEVFPMQWLKLIFLACHGNVCLHLLN